ncbi:hypothetical protein Q7F20_04720 [Curtobacterium sp. A7_M15]|uniref:MmyB family transcriptional regulator n=1 Tax=Curtobacterium sp. A7_M15 TaxID=3065241 RepID=UPI002737BF8C|nr:hypothetical protein [Curtobacterium sp. A7_M15]MDP4332662.1 hypothetical protein [Curtobacterium sp. A7_M15]
MSTDDSADHPRALLGRLLLPWRTVPAVVYDRHLTVRVANALAGAVHPTFRPGENLARAAFLRTAGDSTFRASPEPPDTVPLAARVVAELRRTLDEHDEDRGYVELVGELAARSEAFARLWADPVAAEPAGVVRFDNPVVGRVALAHHRFAVPGPAGDTLLLWRGADEESARRLTSLADTLVD